MNKFTSLKIPAPERLDRSKLPQWEEMRSVFPIYLALAKHSDFEVPFGPERRTLPEQPEPDLFNQVQGWMDTVDQKVMAHQLRHLLQMTTLNASESGLRALILRYLKKNSKSNADRDKIDFLLVQYFALCASPKTYHKQIDLADTASVMKPVLGEVDSTPLAWCEPLEKMIAALKTFRSLRDMLKTDFIFQGRKIKESAGGMFYDPSALIAFIRFNFLLRRTLIELMHADLIAIRSGLGQLEASGAKTLDCHSLGLTAAEPVNKIRQIADEWKQPFQQEYTERSVSQAFEKLLGLRSDVERAVERASAKSVNAAPSTAGVAARATSPNPSAPAKPAESGAGSELDFESCMEEIWEQLIAAPPTRGRSMTTIKIGTARILMSSWEVSAFVSEDGPAAQDLRRAVVARALVTAAVESAKESGNATNLDRALSVARVEVSRLQERVDVAKQEKDTEAAVNLGISTKRLLSALDEADKL